MKELLSLNSCELRTVRRQRPEGQPGTTEGHRDQAELSWQPKRAPLIVFDHDRVAVHALTSAYFSLLPALLSIFRFSALS